MDAPQEFLSEATREREARSTAQDTALMRALGLAHHWQRLLDEQRGRHRWPRSPEAEGMDVTQVRRVMRLTLLAPDVVERLAGSPDAVLEKVMRRPWPNGWGDQDAPARATRVSASRSAPATAYGRRFVAAAGTRSPPLQELPTTTDRI